VVNSNGGADLQSAFGGMKGSGIGRVGGKYSIMSFLEPKTIKLNMAV
jgi:acyl-CoA reductase-like NAD-dependent aldehyde dehydrogenase